MSWTPPSQRTPEQRAAFEAAKAKYLAGQQAVVAGVTGAPPAATGGWLPPSQRTPEQQAAFAQAKAAYAAPAKETIVQDRTQPQVSRGGATAELNLAKEEVRRNLSLGKDEAIAAGKEKLADLEAARNAQPVSFGGEALPAVYTEAKNAVMGAAEGAYDVYRRSFYDPYQAAGVSAAQLSKEAFDASLGRVAPGSAAAANRFAESKPGQLVRSFLPLSQDTPYQAMERAKHAGPDETLADKEARDNAAAVETPQSYLLRMIGAPASGIAGVLEGEYGGMLHGDPASIPERVTDAVTRRVRGGEGFTGAGADIGRAAGTMVNDATGGRAPMLPSVGALAGGMGGFVGDVMIPWDLGVGEFATGERTLAGKARALTPDELAMAPELRPSPLEQKLLPGQVPPNEDERLFQTIRNQVGSIGQGHQLDAKVVQRAANVPIEDASTYALARGIAGHNNPEPGAAFVAAVAKAMGAGDMTVGTLRDAAEAAHIEPVAKQAITETAAAHEAAAKAAAGIEAGIPRLAEDAKAAAARLKAAEDEAKVTAAEVAKAQKAVVEPDVAAAEELAKAAAAAQAKADAKVASAEAALQKAAESNKVANAEIRKAAATAARDAYEADKAKTAASVLAAEESLAKAKGPKAIAAAEERLAKAKEAARVREVVAATGESRREKAARSAGKAIAAAKNAPDSAARQLEAAQKNLEAAKAAAEKLRAEGAKDAELSADRLAEHRAAHAAALLEVEKANAPHQAALARVAEAQAGFDKTNAHLSAAKQAAKNAADLAAQHKESLATLEQQAKKLPLQHAGLLPLVQQADRTLASGGLAVGADRVLAGKPRPGVGSAIESLVHDIRRVAMPDAPPLAPGDARLALAAAYDAQRRLHIVIDAVNKSPNPVHAGIAVEVAMGTKQFLETLETASPNFARAIEAASNVNVAPIGAMLAERAKTAEMLVRFKAQDGGNPMARKMWAFLQSTMGYGTPIVQEMGAEVRPAYGAAAGAVLRRATMQAFDNTRAGMLSGYLLPSPKFFLMNAVQAPAIVYSTLGPRYAATCLSWRAVKVMRALEGIDDGAIVVRNGTRAYTAGDIARLVADNGVSRSQAVAELGARGLGELAEFGERASGGRLRSHLRSLAGYGNNFWTEAANASDNMFRSEAMMKALEAGRTEGQALDIARASLFDYGNLQPWEQGAFGKAVWFWSFRRNNYRQVFKNMLTNPKRIEALAEVSNAVSGATPGEDNDTQFLATQDFSENAPLWRMVSDPATQLRYALQGPPAPMVQAVEDLVKGLTVLTMAGQEVGRGQGMAAANTLRDAALTNTNPIAEGLASAVFDIDIQHGPTAHATSVLDPWFAWYLHETGSWHTAKALLDLQPVDPKKVREGAVYLPPGGAPSTLASARAAVTGGRQDAPETAQGQSGQWMIGPGGRQAWALIKLGILASGNERAAREWTPIAETARAAAFGGAPVVSPKFGNAPGTSLPERMGVVSGFLSPVTEPSFENTSDRNKTSQEREVRAGM